MPAKKGTKKSKYSKNKCRESALKRRISRIYLVNGEEVIKCNNCKEEKPVSSYWKNKRNYCGYDHTCSDCIKKSYKVNEQKRNARRILRLAIKHGEIKRLGCEVCGNWRTAGHHTDYSKPLKVKWLCTPHHAELHHKNKEIGGYNKTQPRHITRHIIKLLNGSVIAEYKSITEASIDNKKSPSTICSYLKGINLKQSQYEWRYKN